MSRPLHARPLHAILLIVLASSGAALVAGDDPPLIRRTEGINIRPVRDNVSAADLDFGIVVDFPGFGVGGRVEESDGAGARVAANPCGSGCRLSVLSPLQAPDIGAGAGAVGQPEMLIADVGVVRFARNGQSENPPADWLIVMEDGDGLVGPLTVPAGADGEPEYPGELMLGGKMIITVAIDGGAPMRLRSREEPIFEGAVPGWPPYGMELRLVNGPIPYFLEEEIDDPQAVALFSVLENTVGLNDRPNEFFSVRPRVVANVIEKDGQIAGVNLQWSRDSEKVLTCENVDTYHVYRNPTPGDARGWQRAPPIPLGQNSLFDPSYDGQSSIEYAVLHAADFPFGYKYEGMFNLPTLVPSRNCPDAGDTHCGGLTITGPPDRIPGVYTVQAGGEDESGDELLYTFIANDGVNRPTILGPQAEPSVEIYLPAGQWQISVRVDDDLGCTDRAPDDTCTERLMVASNLSLLDLIARRNRVLLECFPDIQRSIDGVPRAQRNDEPFLAGEFGVDRLEEAPELASIVDCLTERTGAAGAGGIGGRLWLSTTYAAVTATGRRIGAVRIGTRSVETDCGRTIDRHVVFGTILNGTFSVEPLASETVSCGPFGGCADFTVQRVDVGIRIEQTIGAQTITSRAGPYNLGPSCPDVQFLRGDSNNDLQLDISDGVRLLQVIFLGVGDFDCRAAADANADDDIGGTSDAIYVFNFLFQGGPAPPPPFPDCGEDPTTRLDCAEHGCN